MSFYTELANSNGKQDIKLLLKKLDDIRKAIIGKDNNKVIRRNTAITPFSNIPSNPYINDDSNKSNPDKKENVKASPLTKILETDEQLSKYSLIQIALLEKQLETQHNQLKELQTIKEALVPKVPNELPETLAPKVIIKDEASSGIAPSIGTPDISIQSGNGNKQTTSKKGKGGIKSKIPENIKSKSDIGGTLGKAAFYGTGAVVAGAITTTNIIESEKNKNAELELINQRVQSGELTKDEGETLAQKVIKESDIEKKGAIGSGVGMFGGQIAGAAIGAKIGAFLGPVGAAIGGITGGITGAIAGSEAGDYLGRESDKLVTKVKEFLKITDKTEKINTVKFNEKEFQKNHPAKFIEYKEYKKERFKELLKEIPIELQNEPKEIQKALNIATKEAKEKFAKFSLPIIPDKKPETTNRDILETNQQSPVSVNSSQENNSNELAQKTTESINSKQQLFDIDVPVNNIESISKKESMITPKNDPIRTQMLDTINRTTIQNNDMKMEQELSKQATVQPIISTSISNNDNTNFLPLKPKPRADDNSALGRYQNRISIY